VLKDKPHYKFSILRLKKLKLIGSRLYAVVGHDEEFSNFKPTSRPYLEFHEKATQWIKLSYKAALISSNISTKHFQGEATLVFNV